MSETGAGPDPSSGAWRGHRAGHGIRCIPSRDSLVCNTMKRSFAVAVLTLLLPGVAHAQGDPRLVGLLPSLLGGDAASDFNQAIVSQLSTLPLGSSAGGFTFTFDPNTQTFTRNSDSFGPSLAERATTMGENTFNVGAMYQRATYDSVAGRDLNNGEIRFFVPDIPAPGDVVSAELAINLETDVVVWYMTYGLTDRLDVGTAVPIVRVGLDATVTPTLVQRGDGSLPQGQGIPLPVQSASGSATGLGDIVLHTKYNFLKRPGGGAAAVLDVRLPTGDSDNLLGTGSASGKLLFVASTTLGRVAPHFNGGYTFVGDGANPEIETDDEYNYVAGIEAVVTDRVTVAVDFIARTLTNVGRLRLGAAPPPTPESNAPGNQLNRQEGDLHLRHGAVGLKWNAGRTWLLTTNVMFPLNDAGLVDNFTWSFGLDWTR